jgi:hypothetical protein
MVTRPETFRMTHVSSNGIGVVHGSNASSPLPPADRGSPVYGEISRDPLVASSAEVSTLRCLPARVEVFTRQATDLVTLRLLYLTA